MNNFKRRTLKKTSNITVFIFALFIFGLNGCQISQQLQKRIPFKNEGGGNSSEPENPNRSASSQNPPLPAPQTEPTPPEFSESNSEANDSAKNNENISSNGTTHLAEYQIRLAPKIAALQKQSVFPGDQTAPVAFRITPQRYERQLVLKVASDSCETGAQMIQRVLTAKIPIEAASDFCTVEIEARNSSGELVAKTSVVYDLAPSAPTLQKWCDIGRVLPVVASTLNALASAVQLRGAESDCQELDSKIATTTELNLAEVAALDLRVLAPFAQLQKLSVASSGAHNFAVLAKLENLRSLSLSGVALGSLNALPTLPLLQSLDVSRTGLTSLQGIEVFSRLSELRASENSLSSLRPLAALTQLISFFVANNIDLKILEGLENNHELKTLDLSGTSFQNTNELAHFAQLENLHLAFTPVSNLNFSAQLYNLRTLTLTNTPIASLDPLQFLAKLEVVNFKNTSVVSALPLQNMTNLKLVLLDKEKIDSGNCPAHSASQALNSACVGF